MMHNTPGVILTLQLIAYAEQQQRENNQPQYQSPYSKGSKSQRSSYDAPVFIELANHTLKHAAASARCGRPLRVRMRFYRTAGNQEYASQAEADCPLFHWLSIELMQD